MPGPWRVDRLVSQQPQRVETTWHATKEDAERAEAVAKEITHGLTTLVWFDAFDYARHNAGRNA